MITNNKLLELYNNRKYEELERALKANALEETLKTSKVKTSQASAFKKLYKLCKKSHNNSLHKYHCYNGYNFICDGSFLVGSVADYGIEKCEPDRQLKLQSILDFPVDSEKIEINIDELKFYCKYLNNHKELDKRMFAFMIFSENKEKYIAVDPFLLLEILSFSENNIVQLQGTNSCSKAPLTIKNDKNDTWSILLPVNVTDPTKQLEKNRSIIDKMYEIEIKRN